MTLWREGCGEGCARTCRSRHVAAREGELISREEELVDLRLRVAAADDEIQVRVAVWRLKGFRVVFLRGAEFYLRAYNAMQRLREIVDKGPELRTYK